MNNRWIRRIAFRLLQLIGLVGLVLVALSLLFEKKIIFPAPRYPAGDWEPRGLDHEDVFFHAQDGTALHGWYLSSPHPRGYLLYCHGNGECVAYLGAYAAELCDRYELAVFVFDYRGYGRSAGQPSERGVLQDARAAQSWLAERAASPAAELLLMGRSLGGAVAVDLAAERGAKGLILQNTFTSLVDVATAHFPWYPARLLMRTRFNSLSRIGHYTGPLLQSHAVDDEIIPFRLGRELFLAAPGPKEFFVSEGLGHNAIEPPAYDDRLRQFFDRVLE